MCVCACVCVYMHVCVGQSVLPQSRLTAFGECPITLTVQLSARYKENKIEGGAVALFEV